MGPSQQLPTTTKNHGSSIYASLQKLLTAVPASEFDQTQAEHHDVPAPPLSSKAGSSHHSASWLAAPASALAFMPGVVGEAEVTKSDVASVHYSDDWEPVEP